MTEKFKKYQIQIVKNSKKLCNLLKERKYRIVSGDTENHLILIDLRNKKITGLEAQDVLEKVGIIANKNLIPFDPLPADITSGIRIGTPTITSRGMKEKEMEIIAEWIDETLNNRNNEKILKEISKKIKEFTNDFPIYPE